MVKEPCAYLLSGEPASVQKAAAEIKSKFIHPKNESCDVNTFWGDEATPEEVIEALRTGPFLSKKRLVIVKRAGEFSEADQEKLALYLKHPSESSAFILIAESGELKQPLLDELRENGRLMNFKMPRESKPVSGFALIQAITSQDARSALATLNDLLREGKSAIEIVGLLAWHFNRLSKTKVVGETLKMIADVDLALKSKPVKESYELEVLVIKLCSLGGRLRTVTLQPSGKAPAR